MEAIDQADQITDLLGRSLDMDHKAARGADAIHIGRRAGHRRVPDGEGTARRRCTRDTGDRFVIGRGVDGHGPLRAGGIDGDVARQHGRGGIGELKGPDIAGFLVVDACDPALVGGHAHTERHLVNGRAACQQRQSLGGSTIIG